MLGKRRHELILLGDETKNHRKVLEAYSTEMLDQMISITTSALIISYLMYTFLSDNIYMMLTIPFAIYGIFRYLFLVHTKDIGGEPDMLFKDAGMLLVDYKLEFGRFNGEVLLGDEFTPDGCRIWDIDTREKLDKDRFRQGLGGVVEAYEEVAHRLGVNLD